MAGFTESALTKKLIDLNPSQQSIQTLSLWLIHHRKHHAKIVHLWYKELVRAKPNRKLTFMYLANDVIQNSKKKGPEFGKEFGNILKKAFEHMSTLDDEKTLGSLGRLVNIWDERGVYDSQHIEDFKGALTSVDSPPQKKIKSESNHSSEKSAGSKKERRAKSSPTRERKKSENEVMVEIDGKVETHVTLSPHTPAGDPPEPDELIKALQDLENTCASTDEAVRNRISQLPPEVSELALLDKIEDKETAEKLSVQVNEAYDLLTDYNSRLTQEVENRKRVATMLRDFLQAQKDLHTQAEHVLEEYQEKLQKIYGVRQELKSHIQNLPNIPKLPDVTGGLAPLPSAGDLFSLR